MGRSCACVRYDEPYMHHPNVPLMRALSMLYTCFIHVSHMPYLFLMYVLHMFVEHALRMAYACFPRALCLPYKCFTLSFRNPYTCLNYACTILALPISYSCLPRAINITFARPVYILHKPSLPMLQTCRTSTSCMLYLNYKHAFYMLKKNN